MAWSGAAIAAIAASAAAQAPALTPTSNTTIVVTGPLHYSSIFVPAGITLKFVAAGFGPLATTGIPALITCDGNAIIDGTLWIAGDSINDRAAGWVHTGAGAGGFLCPPSWSWPSGGGLHAGSYGSAMPFSLEGGSKGGDFVLYADQLCATFVSRSSGSEGGGTLAILAGGSIVVGGTITANGDQGRSGGSGGSILLRGAGGVTVLPTGSVTARGGTAPLAPAPWSPQYSFGAPGFVRLDAWGAPPAIAGTVDPPPTALELPFVRTQSQPRLGAPWIFECYAPEAAAIFAAASPIQGNGALTPFGPLGIDLPSSMNLIYAAITPAGHDPFVSVANSVPNTQALRGLNFWVQAFAAPPGLPPRLSNTLAVTVQ